MSFNKAKAMRNAERYLTQGKITAAISEYRRMVENDPDDVNTHNMLGDLYFKAKNPTKAVECYRHVAKFYGSQGFAKKAIALYNKIYRIEPDSIEISAKLADLYRDRGSLAEAKKHYEKLAAHYEATNKAPEALETWERIAELDPSNTEIHLKIAEAYWKDERKDEAVQCFVEAGRRLSEAGQHESAVTAFSKVLEIKPLDDEATKGFVGSQLILGYPEEAAKVLEHKIETDPFNKEMNFLIIDCYYEMNELAAAESTIVKMVEREPSNYPSFLALIEVYTKSDDLDSAVRVISMVTEHMLVGGEHENLYAMLEEILNRNPEHMAALRLLARYHSWLKDEIELKSTLYRLLETANLEGQEEEEKFALRELLTITPHDTVLVARLEELGGLEDLENSNVVEAPEAIAELQESAEGTDRDIVSGNRIDDEDGFDMVGSVGSKDGEGIQLSDSDVSEVNDGNEIAENPGHDEHSTDVHKTNPTEQNETEIDSEDLKEETLADGDTSQDENEEASVKTELSPADELRLEEAIESIRFYIDQGYQGLAEKSLGEIEAEFGKRTEIIELRTALSATAGAESESREDEKAEMSENEIEPSDVFQEPALEEGLSDSVIEQEPDEQEVGYHEVYEEEEAASVGSLTTSDNDIQNVETTENKAVDAEAQIDEESVNQSTVEEKASELAETESETEELTESVEVQQPDPELESEDIIGASDADRNDRDIEVSGVDSSNENADQISNDEVQDDSSLTESDELGASEIEAESDATVTSEAEPEDSEMGFAFEESIDEEQKDYTKSFDNLKDELGLSESEQAKEDEYENHFHHGAAYKGMGLNEDSIREFQDAAKLVGPNDGTRRFFECCTLLSDCFMERGMPSLSIIWLTKAFEEDGLREEELSGLHYELGNALESDGDFGAAKKEFEKVYALDVDYRDVGQRIQKLMEKNPVPA